MGYASSYSTRETITLTNQRYWVVIKSCLSRGELQRAERFLTKAAISTTGTASVEPDVVEYRNAMVTASIVDWNLDDDNGNAIPIVVGVSILSGPDFEKIWGRVDELNSAPSGDEAAQFPAEGVGGDQGTGGGATEPGAVPPGV